MAKVVARSVIFWIYGFIRLQIWVNY